MRVHAFHRLLQYRQSIATREFSARGAKIDRCNRCQVSKQYCLCEYQPDIESNVAVMLIMSENEVFKPSNTGRLIADVVKEAFVFQWNRTEPSQEMLDVLADEQYQPFVVFPEEYVEDKSRLITKIDAATNSSKKPLLIFLDGSWREARRIFRKSPYLATLPVISIKPEVVSQYVMRKSDNENHLSTAEVASLVLQHAGETHAAEELQDWFTVFRETYLLSKTRLKPDYTRPTLKLFLEKRGIAR
ncbi:tRNA-uridine aminocarboxypropyltransferase [Vibrio mexicanus]|uniref:tRNA-uridine aminocarboxypropyltransferase n=1 Tax=Vibrio mexicanus TaxID=1004326 RepID=UPI00094968D9|nr:tRNA-uridine aminocarboxypropyltransferase [Vibrio mexicanus]